MKDSSPAMQRAQSDHAGGSLRRAQPPHFLMRDDLRHDLTVRPGVAIDDDVGVALIERRPLLPKMLQILSRLNDNAPRAQINPIPYQIERDAQVNEDAGVHQVVHGSVAVYHASAGRNDVGVEIEGENVPLFDLAERGESLLLNDGGEGLALSSDNELVGVDEGAAEFAGEQTPDGGFPGPRHSNKDDVRL